MRFHPDRPIRRWCWPWPPVSARPAFADSGSVSSSSRSAWRCSPQRRTLHIKGEEKTTGRCDRYVALVQRIESVVVVVEGNTQKAMMDIHLIAEESATLFTSPRMQSTYSPFRPPPYPYQADCEYWTNHGRLVRRPITNRRYRIEISRSEERNVDDSEELGYRSHKSGQILPFPSRSPFFFHVQQSTAAGASFWLLCRRHEKPVCACVVWCWRRRGDQGKSGRRKISPYIASSVCASHITHHLGNATFSANSITRTS